MSPPAEWPARHTPLDAAECTRLERCCAGGFERQLRSLGLPDTVRELLPRLYLPFAAWIVRERQRRGSPHFVVGVCGGQGSGKTTSCALLREVLETGFGVRVATLSIDDFYLTRETRATLAREVHPLLATRGVPGTHDVALALDTLDGLAALGAGESMPVPVFDKATDDRSPGHEWPRVHGPVDVVLLEGWCVGAVPEPDPALVEPVNRLERDEDREGVWRERVNAALRGPYAELFARLDVLVLLAAGSMADVVRWRQHQERQLAAAATAAGRDATRLAVMSDADVERFVMHYERITRHILHEMPSRADVVVRLDARQRPARIVVARPDPSVPKERS